MNPHAESARKASQQFSPAFAFIPETPLVEHNNPRVLPAAFRDPQPSMATDPMKTQNTKVATRPPNKLPGIFAALVTALITFNVLPKAWSVDLYWTGNGSTPAVAGSGTWVTPETSGFFSWSSTSTSNTPANWVDTSVAHFLGSAGGTATLGSNITAVSINFDPGANAFIVSTNGNVLTIEGDGIVNTSGNTQSITNNGAEISGGGGLTAFVGASTTAGNATITNNGA